MNWRVKFDISKRGFVPEYCEKNLPKPLFINLLNVIDNLHATNFYQLVENLDLHAIPDITNLDVKYLKYLYVILSLIIHKYMWNNLDLSNIRTELPYHIGILYVGVSDKLGITPVMTYSVVLWNWELIDNTKSFSIDNLKCIHTIMNDECKIDEEWFSLVMVVIEETSGVILDAIENIYNEIETNKYDAKVDAYIVENLNLILDKIKFASIMIKRMREKCRPEVWFHKIRIYVAGSNVAGFFKDGLKIKNSDIRLSFKGASGAQSVLLQVFDIFFSINFNSTSEFMMKIKKQSLNKHYEYLDFISKRKSLKDYILENNLTTNNNLVLLFNDCIKELIVFKSIHLNIVKDYVINFISDEKLSDNSPIKFCSNIIRKCLDSKIS